MDATSSVERGQLQSTVGTDELQSDLGGNSRPRIQRHPHRRVALLVGVDALFHPDHGGGEGLDPGGETTTVDR